jgi:hypothetical protein
MSLVSTEDRGATRMIVYANPPFGTMTAAGAAEIPPAPASHSSVWLGLPRNA